jgi:hypothetical protein
MIPQSIQQQYNVRALSEGKPTALVAITKGMYGLPQAGKLAQEQLTRRLAEHGYHPVRNTPCLFKHETRDIAFALVVDDFGIKYKRKEDAEHLLEALKQHYLLTVDWTGSKYVGLSLKFDREQRSVTLSMPGYVDKALERFGVQKDATATNSPAHFEPPVYGRKQQLPTEDKTPLLPPERAKRIQEIVGVMLYYARAVDSSMLTVVNKIGSMQAKPTEQVEAMANRLLQYAANWPDAALTYRASDMRLICYSDASHCSETEGRSRAGGFLYLGSAGPLPDNNAEHLNGAIECISSIIPTVVSSAAEAEYAALFLVGQTAEGLRATLEDLGYPQGPTPIICDNSCAVGITNKTVKQKRSKAIDMRYHWIRDRASQGHFAISWQRGSTNVADFFTKIHAVRHHLQVRRLLVSYSKPDPHLPPTRARTTARHARQQARQAAQAGSGEGVLEQAPTD